MKLNFSAFNKKFNYGIPHIEDLDVSTFIKNLENLKNLIATQKIDGSNLIVGIDSNNKLYTTRENKGGLRFYNVKDFPKTSAYDGFKTAHAVLTTVEKEIKEYLTPGSALNLEILFGEQPNTVLYGKDNLNYIVILESIPGEDPSVIPDQTIIDKLLQSIPKKPIIVKTLVSDTTDGITIVRAPKISTWKIIKADEISKEDISSIKIDNDINNLKKFLNINNKFAKTLGLDKTNYEVLIDKNKKLLEEKKILEEIILTKFKLPIKQKILQLNSNLKSSIQSDFNDNNFYPTSEGIIFTDPKTRERFKVVDKETFTKVNKFNYQVRNSIVGKIISTNLNLPIESRGGLVGEAKIRSIKLFNLDNAELPTQTKKIIEKFKLDNREQTVKNITKSLNQLDFQSIKRKIQAIYIFTLDNLNETLTDFRNNSSDYSLDLNNGQTIKYTKEITRRTLLTFAEAKKQLTKTLLQIKKTNSIEDILNIFFDRQLNDIFGKTNEKNIKSNK